MPLPPVSPNQPPTPDVNPVLISHVITDQAGPVGGIGGVPRAVGTNGALQYSTLYDWGFLPTPFRTVYGVGDGQTFERVFSRFHKVLRQSFAPNLRELVRAAVSGLLRSRISAAVGQMYLSSARGSYLDSPWGEMVRLVRVAGEDDSVYRARISNRLLNPAISGTSGAIVAAVALATGVTPTYFPGTQLLANWDSWQYIWDNNLRGDYNPLAATGHVMYQAGAYSTAGFYLSMPTPRTAPLEAAVRQVLLAQADSGVGWDIVWNDGSTSPRQGVEREWRIVYPVDKAESYQLETGTLYGSVLPILIPKGNA